MKLTKAKLAAAVGLVIGLGAIGQANASVYAGSRLLVQNLQILSSDTGAGIGQPGSDITSFEFGIQNTAALNGAADLSAGLQATCGGTFASNSCGDDPALDANPANAPASNPVRTNNDFSFFGLSLDQYSNSDSVISTAQLTGDPTTSSSQIAETELQNGVDGRASSEVGSSTGFIFELEVDATTDLTISFEADPSMRVAINQLNFLNGNARAGLTFDITLTNDATGDSVTWSPQGSIADNCSVDEGLSDEGVACIEVLDEEDLNRTLSVSSNGTDNSFSSAVGWSEFEIQINNVFAGNWTLALTGFTDTAVRQTQVPVPGTLLLLGAGLMAVGARRAKAAKG